MPESRARRNSKKYNYIHLAEEALQNHCQIVDVGVYQYPKQHHE